MIRKIRDKNVTRENADKCSVMEKSMFATHREIFSKSYQIKLKSDYIYHAPIDFEQQTDTVRLPFQINRGKW